MPAFNWMSLLPIGMNLIGGLLGQNPNQTGGTPGTPTMTPEMRRAIEALFGRATEIANKPYPRYTGMRLATPTQSRSQASQALGSIGQIVNAQLGDKNGYRANLRNMMARGPTQISVPTLVPGGPQATVTQGRR